MLRLYLPSNTFQAQPHLPQRCGTIGLIPKQDLDGRWHDGEDELSAARGMMLGALLGSALWTVIILLILQGLA